MRPIAVIMDPKVAAAIIRHLGLGIRAPPPLPRLTSDSPERDRELFVD